MDISAYNQLSTLIWARGKRPLRNLSPIDKVRAIQRIHNGETKASVSRDIEVPESTLRGWCKNEKKLRFMCHQIIEANAIELLPNLPYEKFHPAVKKRKIDINNPYAMTTKFMTEISNIDKINISNLPINDNIKCDNTLFEDAIRKFVKGNILSTSEEMKKHILAREKQKILPTCSLPCINTSTKYKEKIFNQHTLDISGPMSISDVNPFFPRVSETFKQEVSRSGSHLINHRFNSEENCFFRYTPNYFTKEITYSAEIRDYSLPMRGRKNVCINSNEIDTKYNSNNEEESKFLQWKSILNAPLTHIALVSADTTLQSSSLQGLKNEISEMYASAKESKECQKYIFNDVPEDLSFSSTNSKILTLVNNRTQNPVERNSSRSDTIT